MPVREMTKTIFQDAKRLNMNIKILFADCMLGLMAASCTSVKTQLPYFTDIATVQEGTFKQLEYISKVVPDDELAITVNSTNPAATAAYNLPQTNMATKQAFSQSTTLRPMTYRVDSKGNIEFPVLGTLHVAGLTVEQIATMIADRIRPDVSDPNVTVDLVNFKVNVAGEVRNPGRISVDGNRISILDALTAAGDLTEYGERSRVLVIREQPDGTRQFAHLDLNSTDIVDSPYYYLQQNDYVYVEPNVIRQQNSKYNQNNAFKLSVTSTIVSAASVIASLVIALTVK